MKQNNKWYYHSSLYSRLLRPIKVLIAMLSVKRGRPLVNHLKRMLPLMGISCSISYVKVSITFLFTVSELVRHGGNRFAVIYLKAASVALQQSLGEHYLRDMTPLGVRITRTKGGKLPRIIPVLHRKLIRQGDAKVIKFWLTLLNLYRIIDFQGELKTSTITDPSKAKDTWLRAFRAFTTNYFIRSLVKVARESDIVEAILEQSKSNLPIGEKSPLPKRLKARPFLISKSTPVVKGARYLTEVGEITRAERENSPLSTSPIGLLIASQLWLKNPEHLQILQRWCSLTGNTWVINRISLWGRGAERIVPANPVKVTEYLGTLGIKEESAGKLRVFAMVDPFTQWVLYPLYEKLQQLIRMIPQDGEQDQYAPIWKLLRSYPKGPFYSYDLTAATDRVPILIQQALLEPILGKDGAQAWSDLLVEREYLLNYQKTSVALKYKTGQPMGALSSWHMLSLVHHAIVQWAAQMSGVTRAGEWFDGYALLGDDIVICNSRVAETYLNILDGLGVQVGLAKSLISPRGRALEFAKRTIFNSVDVSPIPFKEYFIGIQNTGAALDLVRKYRLTLSQFLTFRGFGYRVKSRILQVLRSQNRRVRHAILAYHSLSIDSKSGKFVNFLAMKSVLNTYKVTDSKVLRLIERFAFHELLNLELRLESESFKHLLSVVRDYSTVRKDREFYGTTDRGADRITDFQDITYEVELPKVKPRLRVTNWNPEPRVITLTVSEQIARLYQSVDYKEAWDSSTNAYDQAKISAIQAMIRETSSAIRAKGPIEITIEGDPPLDESIDSGPISINEDTKVIQQSFDSIKETVYRQAFLDVIIEVRDIKSMIENIRQQPFSPSSFEDLWIKVDQLMDTLANLPLPKNLYKRIEEDAVCSAVSSVKRWEQYSPIFNSTDKTLTPIVPMQSKKEV